MTIEIKNDITYIVANNGYFLSNGTIYGEIIVLGTTDSPNNYQEFPLSEMPIIEEPQPPQPEEIINTEITDSEALNIILFG